MSIDQTVRPPISPTQPGAYSAVDASGLSGLGVTGPVVAVLGATTGGPPNVLQLYRDPQGLKSRLRSGAAFDVARFAMQAGALPVGVMRIGTGILQATKSLAGATSNPVTLTSKDYGAWNNSIQVQVEANNRITIIFTDPTGIVYKELFDLGATATVQNIVNAINGVPDGFTSGFSGSQYVTAAVTAGTLPLAVAAAANLTGGNDGSALAAGDWTAGLTVLEAENVDIVVPATGDSTVHAQVQTHCDSMSSTLARKERVGEFGAVLGETVSAEVTRMAGLRDRRSKLLYPGFKAYDVSGALQTYDPFYLAGVVAGMHASLPDPATSLTHVKLPSFVIDLEQQAGKYLSTAIGSDVDLLLRAQVTPVTPAPGGGFWIVDDLSGYNTDDSFRDFHKVRAADAVSQALRNGLESAFVGKKVLDGSINDIKVKAAAICTDLQTATIIRAFKPQNIQVAQNGTDAKTYNLTVPVLLPDAVKYIFITVALQAATTVSPTSIADTATL